METLNLSEQAELTYQLIYQASNGEIIFKPISHAFLSKSRASNIIKQPIFFNNFNLEDRRLISQIASIESQTKTSNNIGN